MALLRVPRRSDVLPAVEQRVPPPLLPLPPPQPLPPPHGLRRHRHHDCRLLLPAHLLRIPVRSSLAGYLPRRHIRHGLRHGLHTTLSAALHRRVPGLPCATLFGDGLLWLHPGGARGRRELGRTPAERDAGLRGSHGGLLLDGDHLLRDESAGEVETGAVRHRRTQSPDIPRVRDRRRGSALRRGRRLPAVARPRQMRDGPRVVTSVS